ncbi:hypothetical protein KY290_023202 [Solanum tuberosum]|uniref:Uncharacterized protein n=1 Tax=Solanum tuberosum TaxID=4113 RepID=A0ABQ7V6J1_SOLTU|nr:hypothetical protein KY290_023202 [Solanum tuberosum]
MVWNPVQGASAQWLCESDSLSRSGFLPLRPEDASNSLRSRKRLFFRRDSCALPLPSIAFIFGTAIDLQAGKTILSNHFEGSFGAQVWNPIQGASAQSPELTDQLLTEPLSYFATSQSCFDSAVGTYPRGGTFRWHLAFTPPFDCRRILSTGTQRRRAYPLPPGVRHGRGKGLLEPGREVQMFILRDEGQAVEEESFVMDIGFLILREQGI